MSVIADFSAKNFTLTPGVLIYFNLVKKGVKEIFSRKRNIAAPVNFGKFLLGWHYTLLRCWLLPDSPGRAMTGQYHQG